MRFKIFLTSILLLIIILAIIIFTSPYGRQEGFNYKLVKHTVHINAPADSVFRYLGNSGNAVNWSVFVDHISSLNSDSLVDGQPGSRRRCFCKKDESGIRWDETITEVDPGKKRQLTCYDFYGFSMTVDGIATEQKYESSPDGSSDLTFTFFIKDRKPNILESLKLYIGSYKLHSIFKRNLENIKAICEGHPPIHPKE